ncbi:tail fiber domain-containing protein [Olleya sp. HaHaR_3_96]|uniref:tail fiber domain-containing protein n=1 Tax=Olleya sp. HaHaR_3_96 TaxID=2745560 RepID=UPI001C500D56|nr:tail fiber domain-containing protein [Olleya sp. HaHaR_3_96]QXP61572.1 tail fiber domain-containing protein [Olleya sp. HaHaR_3_96]
MIKNLHTFLVALLITVTTLAQTPEKMSYQALVRNATDDLVSNQAIGMQISILETTATGTAVYVETQNPTTNINGLVTLEIGSGSIVSGDFTTIDWSAGAYFIKTETDPTGGSNYTITGTSQLMSVPYALYAKTSGSSTPGPIGPQGVAGADGVDGATGAQGLQGIAGTDGVDGVDGAAGAQGLQGIAGTDGVDGAAGAQGLQGIAGTDGIDGATGAQGLQGIAGTDGIDGATGAQGLQGVAGNDGADGATGPQGLQGVAGNDGADGATGPQGLTGNDGADGIGTAQTLSFTSPNISLSDGGGTIDLTALIDDADSDPDNEIQNITLAGAVLSISGGNSVTLPSNGGIWSTVSTDYNQIEFTGEGDAEIRGGSTDLSGDDFGLENGVFWGSNPGEDTGMFTDGDQIIFISPADGELVQFWEEDTHLLVAQISAAGAYSQVSDETLKKNIVVIDNALEKTLNLSGYTYEFKQSKEDIKKGTPVELGIGILAQELQRVAPRLVTKTDQGHFVVNYDGIIPILIEATKEQQGLINAQQTEIDNLKAEIEAIKLMLSKR